MVKVRLLAATAAFLLPLIVPAQKRPLDASAYDGWNSIRGTALSRDGGWLLYVLTPQEGDPTAFLRSVEDGHTITIPRGTALRFSRDSRFVVGTVLPSFEETRKARRAKAKPEDMPKNALVIVDLQSGQKTELPRVASYQMAEEDQDWILYQPEPAKPEEKPGPIEPNKPTPTGPPNPTPPPATAPANPPPGRPSARGGRTEGTGATPSGKTGGSPYVLRNLATGKEERLEDVGAASFDKYGETLAYTTEGKDSGITLYDLVRGTKRRVAGGGKFPRFAVSDHGKALAFTAERDDVAKTPMSPPPKSEAPKSGPKPPVLTYLYLFETSKGDVRRVGDDSMPAGWSVNGFTSPRFSEKGGRLLYATSPKPLPEPQEVPEDERVSVDIWNWKDARLQPEQLKQVTADRQRGYSAVYDLATGKSVQLGSSELPRVQISDRGDGPVALAVTDLPYEREASWNPGDEDVYLVDVKTGTRKPVFTKVQGSYSMSPDGRWLAAYLGSDRRWCAVDTKTLARQTLAIPTNVYDETDDHPATPPPYGALGWTKDGHFLVRDRYDIWSVNPQNGSAVALTEGRSRHLRFSIVRLDPDEPTVTLEGALLTSLDDDTKQAAVYRMDKGGLIRLLGGCKSYGGFAKAKDADTMVYTQQDFVEFPDLWLTDTAFAKPQKVSDANPQQREYNWGKAELVTWTSNDGVPLQGILIKPEDFDYGKKYPLVTYYYEKNSDSLFTYRPPAPSASTVNLTYLASNGYCVFVPDIVYKVGYPGPSATSCILPGVQSIVNRGYIDPKRLGLQGQSWGGYETAYLVTQSDMFACAGAGAPVGDMFSAYGGIRYGSGMVRQFQYEHDQSRIGGTPWDSTLAYIENSPVFWANRVRTPLFIMSNDEDGAVPHTQGIELFTALRRLEKPAWMVVYNGEDHNIVQRKNRKDYSIRLYQFFDHYLKGAPEPIWMSRGIPAVDKGRTMGTETSSP